VIDFFLRPLLFAISDLGENPVAGLLVSASLVVTFD